MRKGASIALAVGLAGAFAFVSIVCGSVHIQAKSAAAPACCPSKAKNVPLSDNCSGCPIALKSVDHAKSFVFAAPQDSDLFSAIEVFAFTLPSTVVISIFSNGPPGPLRLVPLYTQFHSLRI